MLRYYLITIDFFQFPGQPGYDISDICHNVNVLRSFDSHLGPLLANIPYCPKPTEKEVGRKGPGLSGAGQKWCGCQRPSHFNSCHHRSNEQQNQDSLKPSLNSVLWHRYFKIRSQRGFWDSLENYSEMKGITTRFVVIWIDLAFAYQRTFRSLEFID